ncbi:hypothetical protein JOQ06_002672 [Pogonophryne albipinna]|uniref:Uncharacterized protein n=1 Tax=Pogonophryne albipinna TaxID=1090488 RepID=A0AAD6B4U2_9TELE|nr:hypothetical protein JOQ06_002672 [Pogonophryne albipinna]
MPIPETSLPLSRAAGLQGPRGAAWRSWGGRGEERRMLLDSGLLSASIVDDVSCHQCRSRQAVQVTGSFEAGVVSFKEQRSVIRESSEACVLPAGRGAHTVALQVTRELLRQEERKQRVLNDPGMEKDCSRLRPQPSQPSFDSYQFEEVHKKFPLFPRPGQKEHCWYHTPPAGVKPPLLSSVDNELELSEVGGGSKVVAGRDLETDTMWGPYPGILQSEGSTEDPDTEVRPPLTSCKESVMVTEAEPLSLCINPYTHGHDALPE